MTITITAEQRDVLYEEAVGRLNGIDSVWHAYDEKDFAAADRLAREYSDLLQLLFEGEGLGWGERGSGSVELRTPAGVLRRSLGWLREGAARRIAPEAEELDETCRLLSICEEVLAKPRPRGGSVSAALKAVSSSTWYGVKRKVCKRMRGDSVRQRYC